MTKVQVYVSGPTDGGSYSLAHTFTGSGLTSDSFTYAASEGDGSYEFYSVATDAAGNVQTVHGTPDTTTIEDRVSPTVASIVPSVNPITAAQIGTDTFSLAITFSEAMNTSVTPTVVLASVPSTSTVLSPDLTNSYWNGAHTVFTEVYTVNNISVSIPSVNVTVSGAKDLAGNIQVSKTVNGVFAVNTVSPYVVSLTPSVNPITSANVGTNGFHLTINYSTAMNASGSADDCLECQSGLHADLQSGAVGLECGSQHLHCLLQRGQLQREQHPGQRYR